MLLLQGMELLKLEEVIECALRSHQSILNLSHRQITIVPSSILKLKDLTTLLLNNNKLLMPPSEITVLSQLQELLLDHNQLTMVPSGIGCLRQLTYLSISHNPLGVLPSEIGELRNLTQLWIMETQLDLLPREIGNLRLLEKLGARGNFLTSLPEEMQNMRSLQWLHLAENKLDTLGMPTNFSKLTNLVYLNLDSNRFSRVPQCLSELPQLTSLSMKTNCIQELGDDMVLGLSRLNKLDLRDTGIIHRPEHWKGLDYILVGKTGLDEELTASITSDRDSLLLRDMDTSGGCSEGSELHSAEDLCEDIPPS